MYNYLLAINKPTGLTSSDVVIRCKKILSNAFGEKVKVGHMGTLDPGASGVLLLGINKATRLFDYFLLKSKSYIGRLTFGKTTDTLDSYGAIIATSDLPDYEALINSLNNFIGEIEQVPPKYSAIKINGRKACDLARKNIDIDIESRKVNIFKLEEISTKMSNNKVESIDLKVECSSGTYIRTLFLDIAKGINCVGYMAYLIRNSLHSISINDCVTLQELELNPTNYFINPLDLIKDFMPVYELNDEEFILIQSGRTIEKNIDEKYIALTYKNELKFIAINDNNILKSNTNLE